MQPRKWVQWTRIRGLGELHILTRGSYFFLIAVPMLAAMWPAIQIGISQYNFALGVSIDALDYAAHALEASSETSGEEHRASPVSSSEEKMRASLREIRAETSALRDVLKLSLVENSNLPRSWAILFFASLSISIGHFIYQLFTPQLVRDFGIDEYSAQRKSDYTNNPTTGSLQAALSVLREHGDSEHDDSSLTETGTGIPSSEQWELDIIEAGAQLNYRRKSQASPSAIVSSALFYLTGIVLVLLVVVEQSVAVGAAADWWN